MQKENGISWLRKIAPSVLLAALAFVFCLLMAFGLFRNELEPTFGTVYPKIFQFEIEFLHWVGALLGFWLATSLSIGRLVKTPKGLLISGFLAMVIALGAWTLVGLNVIESNQTHINYAATFSFWMGWLGVQIARLPFDWAQDGNPSRTNEAKIDTTKGLQEHFYYLFASLIGLATITSLQIWPDVSFNARQVTTESFAVSMILTTMVVTAFLPLIIGAWKRAFRLAQNSKRSIWRNDVVTGQWAATFVAGIVGVSFLAISAARHASDAISARVAYLTYGGVFCLFLMVIVVPHLWTIWKRYDERSVSGEPKKHLIDQRAQASIQPPAAAGIPLSADPRTWFTGIVRFFNALAKLFSYVDTLAVKILAPISGGVQPHWSHLHVIGLMGLLSVLGLIFPRPFGLVPLGLGILLIISLGRRWAWVEGDRETASRLELTHGDVIHLGFDNDLKDEALTGYAWLFFLVPLTLYQLQDITRFQPVLNQQSDNVILVWFQFFGGELAKAVPFVDWWDIYGNKGVSATGKHLTFISRAAVDLVILTALFQALGIWQRNRVQSVLYKDGHLEAFDPFKEQEFFQRGMIRLWGQQPHDGLGPKELAEANEFKKKIETLRKDERLYTKRDGNAAPIYYQVRETFKKQIAEHIEAREKILGEALNKYEKAQPYSRQRLAELISPTKDEDLQAGAYWMIEQWDVLVGTPIEQLKQIAQRWLKDNFPNEERDNPQAAIRSRRVQKMEFERILVELSEAKWTNKISKQVLSDLMRCLHQVRNHVEFDFSRILALELFGKLKTEYAVLFLSQFVLTQEDLQKNDPWRLKTIGNTDVGMDDLYLGRMDMRERVYEAARRVGCNSSAGDAARRRALELLEWMSSADRAKTSLRRRVAMLAEETRHCLKTDGLFAEE